MIQLLVLAISLFQVTPDTVRIDPAGPFDIVLTGGTVVDGTGEPGRVADVGIIGDRIAAVGDLSDVQAAERIDVAGLVVAPGFIDIHSHGTGATFEASGVYLRPHAENYLRQGVTTIFGGQDGASPYPIGSFLEALEAAPSSVNVGLFVGHNTIRSAVIGNTSREPSGAEVERMRAMARQAMEEGAFGLSTGLEYTPGAYATTEEIIEVARELAPFGGLHISHIRDEGARLLESVSETIYIGEKAGIPTQVTHHKVIGKQRWGASKASLRLIDEARARGVDVSSDVYPYTASSTGMTILFPRWSLEGSRDELLARLSDPDARAQIKREITEHLRQERGADPSTVVAAYCAWDPSLSGQSLQDMLEARGEEVTLENAAEMVMELQERGGCQGVFHSMSEEDMIRILQHRYTMVSSDGGIPEPGVGVPHPRSYGTFARILGRYVREEGVIDLPSAIHKMTGLAAWRTGLADRGLLKPGRFADIAIFNPSEIIDRATFTDPHQFAEGMVHVFVNGTAVLQNGEVTGERPGRALRFRSVE